jgi:RNA polymerase sigma-70 factor, ECF subfamily
MHVTSRTAPLEVPFGAVGPAPRLRGTPPESSALEAARAGDTRAFRTVYETHVARVHALCLRLTGDGGLAEELTQDVFVRAWERLGTFRGESAFGTWLHRLTVNEVLMARRTARRRERRVEIHENPPDAPSRSGPHVEDAMDLERAIARLPEGCRTVFVLHDVEGWRHEEIAAMNGTAVGTSKAHLFRARRLLREMLDR